LSARSKEIYNRREQGEKFTDIGKVVGLHISNVSRNYYKSLAQLREELKKTLGKEIVYNGD
jgi:DNA-directed RNA polymerase specialized sigma subunit